MRQAWREFTSEGSVVDRAAVRLASTPATSMSTPASARTGSDKFEVAKQIFDLRGLHIVECGPSNDLDDGFADRRLRQRAPNSTRATIPSTPARWQGR